MRIHTNDKRFKCNYCQKEFASKVAKNNHEKRH